MFHFKKLQYCYFYLKVKSYLIVSNSVHLWNSHSFTIHAIVLNTLSKLSEKVWIFLFNRLLCHLNPFNFCSFHSCKFCEKFYWESKWERGERDRRQRGSKSERNEKKRRIESVYFSQFFIAGRRIKIVEANIMMEWQWKNKKQS